MRRSIFALLIAALGSLLSFSLALADDDNGGRTEEETANIEATQAFIDAFTAGDMDTVMDTLSDDIVWYCNGDGRFVPSHGTWTGKDEVGQWMADIDATWEFLDFGVDQYLADGDTVIVQTHERDRAKATGKEVSERDVLIVTWTDGKIVHMQAWDDSASEAWALTPEQ